MKVAFAKPEIPASGTLVALAADGRKLGKLAGQLDKATKGAITRALEASRFKGGAEEFLTILAPAGVEVARIIVAGIGTPAKYDALAAQSLGGRLVAALNGTGEKDVSVWVEQVGDMKLEEAEFAANLAYGARLRFYRFDKYKTKEKPEQKPSLKHFNVLVADAADAKRAFGPMDKVVDAVNFTRDLVSEPANVIYPETLAAEAKTLDRARRRGEGAGRQGDDQARHGRAARRRPGQQPRKPARHHAVERRAARRSRSPSSARA